MYAGCSPPRVTKCGRATPGVTRGRSARTGLRVEGSSVDRTCTYTTTRPAERALRSGNHPTRPHDVARSESASRCSPRNRGGRSRTAGRTGHRGAHMGREAGGRLVGRFRRSMKGLVTRIKRLGIVGWGIFRTRTPRLEKMPRCGSSGGLRVKEFDAIDQLCGKSWATSAIRYWRCDRAHPSSHRDADAWRVASAALRNVTVAKAR